MKERNLKIALRITSILLLISLIIKLAGAPGGLVLSALLMGGMILIGVIIGCLIIALLLSLCIKKYSFSTLYFFLSSIAFIVFHYQLYSPTLKIIVPNGYTGEINLVLSNVDKNILTIDSNGVGYLTERTFNRLWSKPNVYTTTGDKINDLCVGFNPSTFWGLSNFCCVHGRKIKSLTFEIVPADKKGQKQYYNRDFHGSIDTSKLLEE